MTLLQKESILDICEKNNIQAHRTNEIKLCQSLSAKIFKPKSMDEYLSIRAKSEELLKMSTSVFHIGQQRLMLALKLQMRVSKSLPRPKLVYDKNAGGRPSRIKTSKCYKAKIW